MLKVREAVVEDAAVLWRAEAETAATPGQLISTPEELDLRTFDVARAHDSVAELDNDAPSLRGRVLTRYRQPWADERCRRTGLLQPHGPTMMPPHS